jgi:hypothetical protein
MTFTPYQLTVLQNALVNAIDWQESLADANSNDPQMAAKCMCTARKYQRLIDDIREWRG